MPLIGTAGHVDHGKSTLIRRLTGRDPDRWSEEKERGLTIDLGFAWMTLEDGTEVSFVDVPGHERYLKNMLAGIEAIDTALFVVAADEGWMPQSEEHLAVLDLLDVDRGVVALTKADAVDSDLLELAMLEVEEHLSGTSLENASILPVSALTGQGVDDLVAELERLLSDDHPLDLGRPRLWVDRSFTARGAGTIVTGSLLDGRLAVDDGVEILPGGRPARIRGIQSHEESLEEVSPRRRVALNLGGVDRSQVERGDMVGLTGQWETTRRLVASIRTARYVDEIDRRGAYQVHIGSSVTQAVVTGLGDGVAVLKLAEEVPIATGDRFIVRDTGRRLVVAGGRVLDPAPGPTGKAMRLARSIDPTAGPDDIARTLLELRGIETRGRLGAHSRGGTAAGAFEAGGLLVSRRRLSSLQETAIDLVTTEHTAHPLRVGIPLATMAERLGVPLEVAELVVEESPELERVGPDVAVKGRSVDIPEEMKAAWDRAREMLASDLAVPGAAELGLDSELVHLLIRRGELIRIGDDLLLLPDQVERLRDAIKRMPPDFTVADFRDAVGLSRKYAVPILEWADREGLTVRRGDTRTAR